MLLLKFVNAVWCELYLMIDFADAGAAYTECLQTAQGNAQNWDCYVQLLTVVGEASLEYFSCML